jgi:hypothetical protein
MIDPKFQLDAKKLAERMQKMGSHLQGRYEEVLREGTRDYATEIVKHSYPSPGNNPLSGQGNTQGAKQQGEDNVRRDIISMFKPIDRYSVSAFVKNRNSSVFQMADPIDWRSAKLRQAWEKQDMDTLYEAFKKNDFVNSTPEPADDMPYVETPTIGVQNSMMNRGRWNGKDSVLVRNRKVIEAFVSERIKSVGKSVNGWIDIVRQLKGSVSKTMSGRGIGSATLSKDKEGASYVLKNPYGNPNGMMNQALKKVSEEQKPIFRAKVDAFIKSMIKAGGGKA